MKAGTIPLLALLFVIYIISPFQSRPFHDHMQKCSSLRTLSQSPVLVIGRWMLCTQGLYTVKLYNCLYNTVHLEL